MAKLDLNPFINKHQVRICLFIQFPDYARLKKAAAKAKRPVPPMKTGKELPPPNRVITKLVPQIVKGDYVIKSHADGAVQQVMVADQVDAQNLAKVFGAAQFAPGDGRPCTAHAKCSVDMETHIKLAEKLGLL